MNFVRNKFLLTLSKSKPNFNCWLATESMELRQDLSEITWSLRPKLDMPTSPKVNSLSQKYLPQKPLQMERNWTDAGVLASVQSQVWELIQKLGSMNNDLNPNRQNHQFVKSLLSFF